MYVDEGLTAQTIGRRLQCSEQTIRRRLVAAGIAVRPPGPQPRAPDVQIEWSSDLAWVVGLIATDGNLSRERFGLSIVSRDIDLLESVRRCLGRDIPIRPHGRTCSHLQWRDRNFYRWLVEVGLTPAKSLTLGPLRVPDEHFADFFRGCVDGDGSVLVYDDRYHTDKKQSYVYERLYVSVVSASRSFIDWLQRTNARLLGIFGTVDSNAHRPHPIWKLRYAKAESIHLLSWMYYAPDVPCLARKRSAAGRFLLPLGHSPNRPPGRPRAGWRYGSDEFPSVQEPRIL